MENEKNLTCVVCPAGCSLTVTMDRAGKVLSVTGNTCPRGKKYAESEMTHPERTLTSTVALRSAAENRLPVKTDKPIPKEMLFDAMRQIMHITATVPVHRGDVLVEDFIVPGVCLVACKTVES